MLGSSQPDSGTDRVFLGLKGESVAKTLLLDWFIIGNPTPDIIGVDYVGFWRVRPHDDTLTQELSRVAYRFQVKATIHGSVRKSSARRVTVKSGTFLRWTRDIDHQPLVLIRVEFGPEKTNVRFLVLYQWLLDHPSAVSAALRQKFITFNECDFRPFSALPFQCAMLAEGRRVLRQPGALWRIWQSRRVPCGTYELLQNLGRLERVEIPQRLLTQIQGASGSLTFDDATFLAHLLRLPPSDREDPQKLTALVTWRERLSSQMSAESRRVQTHEFGKFVTAMRGGEHAEHLHLPVYSATAMSVWRTCVQLFPESITLLTRVFHSPQRWSPRQRALALLLASTVANAEDVKWSAAACDLIRSWEPELRVGSATGEPYFTLIRDFLVARAESHGGQSRQSEALDFIYRSHRADNSVMLKSALGYYPDEDTWIRRMHEQVSDPKPRELRTKRIHAGILELLQGAF
jgi:hypothetical protein